jgi:hypothetical protein
LPLWCLFGDHVQYIAEALRAALAPSFVHAEGEGFGALLGIYYGSGTFSANEKRKSPFIGLGTWRWIKVGRNIIEVPSWFHTFWACFWEGKSTEIMVFTMNDNTILTRNDGESKGSGYTLNPFDCRTFMNLALKIHEYDMSTSPKNCAKDLDCAPRV